MKKYLVLLVFFTACNAPKTPVSGEVKVIHDTVYLPELPPSMPDTVYIVKNVVNGDSIRILKDTINARTKRLNLAQYKLSKVDYYVKIVDSKPSQLTFLKGWIKRALRD